MACVSSVHNVDGLECVPSLGMKMPRVTAPGSGAIKRGIIAAGTRCVGLRPKVTGDGTAEKTAVESAAFLAFAV